MPKQAQLKKANDNLFLNIYKIGDIYITTNSENPSDRFGGQWEQIQDKFLLCAGSAYGAGTTGGNTSHIHTTGNHTLTNAELPYLEGNLEVKPYDGYSNTGICSNWHTDGYRKVGPTSNANQDVYGSKISFGGNQAHNHGNTGSSSNMPPYLAVYVWKRIA